MIKHIVFWKVKEELRQEAFETFCGMTDHLRSILPEIVETRAGMNFNEGDGYHICVDAVFRNEKDLETYIYHPDHLKVREYMTSISYDKTVFDYYFDE